jgi:hypothetical protein
VASSEQEKKKTGGGLVDLGGKPASVKMESQDEEQAPDRRSIREQKNNRRAGTET